ncbi:NADH-cytochrome b5 reductase [Hamiltosporidium tvaerminnensis]|uniref:NADH-cytochrome b5 reductase n=1 Tax=Hamiltosporidium tvaerminnensis TaxID=1176355 RepID=A0A4Q9KZC1_9MICR|nr:hypothetical protein LUQ84_001850 [Hamiltosporidium tvaerminnensis]TBU00387.1 NADH-cytochrome b5 reductase [Hamiltosporidium tvaerminnensis]
MENYLDSYQIIEKYNLNHNTIFITVKKENIPEPQKTPVSHFFYIYNDDYSIKRPYTPIQNTPNSLSFAIKIYEKGNISKYLNSKKINEKIKLSKPIPKRKYNINEFKNILMIAGGTGITPMLQILEYSLNSLEDKTIFNLIFCNLSEKDIFLNNKLIEYEKSNRCNVIHVLENKETESKHIKGRININIIKKYSNFDFCYVCGPPPMIKDVCGSKGENNSQGCVEGMLKELEFYSENVYKF